MYHKVFLTLFLILFGLVTLGIATKILPEADVVWWAITGVCALISGVALIFNK